MLSIARAIIEPRRLILIDEPTKGIAPAIIDNMIRAFEELKRDGTTILLVEQNFRFAEALGDFAVVMDDGRIVHRDGMAALARTRRRRRACSGCRWRRMGEFSLSPCSSAWGEGRVRGGGRRRR